MLQVISVIKSVLVCHNWLETLLEVVMEVAFLTCC